MVVADQSKSTKNHEKGSKGPQAIFFFSSGALGPSSKWPPKTCSQMRVSMFHTFIAWDLKLNDTTGWTNQQCFSTRFSRRQQITGSLASRSKAFLTFMSLSWPCVISDFAFSIRSDAFHFHQVPQNPRATPTVFVNLEQCWAGFGIPTVLYYSESLGKQLATIPTTVRHCWPPANLPRQHDGPNPPTLWWPLLNAGSA